MIIYSCETQKKGEENEKEKYRELLELKGLMREKKVTYVTMSKYLNMALSAFSNKINGNSVFNIIEINKICKKLNIDKSNIPYYFF